jgi:hypothetical protein
MPPKFRLGERVLYGSDTATGFKEGDNVFYDGCYRGTVLHVNEDDTIRLKSGDQSRLVSPKRFQAVEGTITEVEKRKLGEESMLGTSIAYKVELDNPQLDTIMVRENELTQAAVSFKVGQQRFQN